jgi:rhamnose utilization protein RhaD (predicted bifunctional aldolase and dehydrogenase)
MAETHDAEDEFAALKRLSARIGADPALVQAAGGNTSIKQNDVLCIKASGTWLMNAVTDDIMVPVALEPLLDALARQDPAAEKASDFVVQADNPSGLRPSIETSVHAVMPQRVVLHVHCIETIAIAVRQDAQSILSERLAGFDWVFVPYVRPGLPLSRAISKRLKPQTNVLVLGNHGLVVAGETVADAARLLADVTVRLVQPDRMMPPPDPAALDDLTRGSAYVLPAESAAHGAATDPVSCKIASGGSLYPDHVIFLGEGSVISKGDESAEDVRAGFAARGKPEPVSILFPGRGIVMQESANAGAQALARCLADVAARVPAHARLRYLLPEENDELLNWDAEKYRQVLEKERAAKGQGRAV